MAAFDPERTFGALLPPWPQVAADPSLAAGPQLLYEACSDRLGRANLALMPYEDAPLCGTEPRARRQP
jgi:hypothetical protein